MLLLFENINQRFYAIDHDHQLMALQESLQGKIKARYYNTSQFHCCNSMHLLQWILCKIFFSNTIIHPGDEEEEVPHLNLILITATNEDPMTHCRFSVISVSSGITHPYPDLKDIFIFLRYVFGRRRFFAFHLLLHHRSNDQEQTAKPPCLLMQPHSNNGIFCECARSLQLHRQTE